MYVAPLNTHNPQCNDTCIIIASALYVHSSIIRLYYLPPMM